MIIGIYKGTFAPFTYGNLQIIKLISQYIEKSNDDYEIWIQLESQDKVVDKFNQLYTEDEINNHHKTSNNLNFLSPETFNWTRRLLTVVQMINFYDQSDKIKIIETDMETPVLIEKALKLTNNPIYWISSHKINQNNDLDDDEYQIIKQLYSEKKIVGVSVENLFQNQSSEADSIRRDLEYVNNTLDNIDDKVKRLSSLLYYTEIFDFLMCKFIIISCFNNQERDNSIEYIKKSISNNVHILHLTDYYYPREYLQLTDIKDTNENYIPDYRHPFTIDQSKLLTDLLLLSSKYKSIIIEGVQALQIPSLIDLAVGVLLIVSDPIKSKFAMWKSLKHSSEQSEWIKYSNYWNNYVIPRVLNILDIYDKIPSHKKINRI
jgi:hypothetical protein